MQTNPLHAYAEVGSTDCSGICSKVIVQPEILQSNQASLMALAVIGLSTEGFLSGFLSLVASTQAGHKNEQQQQARRKWHPYTPIFELLISASTLLPTPPLFLLQPCKSTGAVVHLLGSS